jgi:heterodisulfide reductase subunit A
VVDVPSTVDYALTLPHVVHAQEQLFSCATNSIKEITDTIEEKGLNRVVVAACSPRTLEPLFRDTLREAGINQYYYEMANIREHCSWCHSREKEAATARPRTSPACRWPDPPYWSPCRSSTCRSTRPPWWWAAGLAGMTCALSIADQGHEVYLLEKEADLGGSPPIYSTLDGQDVQAFLKDLVRKVYRHL